MKKAHLALLSLLTLTSPLLATQAESVKIVSQGDSLFRLGTEQGSHISKVAISPVYYHYINSIHPNRDFIELEDGSKWKVDPDDIQEMYSWRMGDTLTITANHKWFSNYTYKLKNLYTDREVKVNPFVGPVAFGPYSHWIVAIDYPSQQLFLENGTSWHVASCNNEIFRNWAVNDTIILGVSYSWCSSFDSILINVNMNNYAYTKQF
jgi:hypothetical protein